MTSKDLFKGKLQFSTYLTVTHFVDPSKSNDLRQSRPQTRNKEVSDMDKRNPRIVIQLGKDSLILLGLGERAVTSMILRRILQQAGKREG
ncbi:MAG TPA: hypothetical protein DEF45_05810 [Rhodopirellula sp.]|nr:hypothetical protein [Rhodopirellula sp.]